MLPLLTAYPEPPYRYRRIVGSNLLCRADQQALERLVPPPLHLHPEHHVWLYAVELTGDTPLALEYHELGIFVPVLWQDQPGFFPLVLFLDQALPIVIGREVWGFPKLFANPILVERDSEAARAAVTPDLNTSLRWSMHVATEPSERVPARRHRVFTHRYLPAADRSFPPAVDELIELTWETAEEQRYRGSHCQLLSSWAGLPELKVLESLEVLAGWYSEIDGCVLEAGRQVHQFKAVSSA